MSHTARIALGFPMQLDDIDIYDPETHRIGVPHDQFALLRRESPVWFQREPDGPGYWALTKHADIVAVPCRVGRSCSRPSSAASTYRARAKRTSRAAE